MIFHISPGTTKYHISRAAVIYSAIGLSCNDMKKWLVASFVSLSVLLYAQEKIDEVTDARMRSEELEHSKIMHTLHMLTDRYGPRVTGTPNHELAAKWAVSQMTEWGFKN